MTLSDDLNFAEQVEGSEQAITPSWTAFGISFTPPIIGGIIGVLGILGSVYMVFTIVIPASDELSQQQTKKTGLESDITAKNLQASQIDKVENQLKKVKQQHDQVLSLFANEKSIETLLLDTNRLIEAGNSKDPLNPIRARLKKYTPTSDKPEIITDSSYGPLVNNKLKRLRFNMEIFGSFAQTKTIMQNIERLQPLLIVKNYESKIGASSSGKKSGNSAVPIATTFQLEALMPLTPQETDALAKTPPKK